MSKILITGATGFLGAEIVSQLAKQDHVIYTLVRAKNENEALWRLKSNYAEMPELCVRCNAF